MGTKNNNPRRSKKNMASKKLNIAIFTHNYPANSRDRKDAGIFIYDYAHELAKHANVFIFCPDYGDKKEKYIKVPVYWYNWGGKGKKLGNWKLYSPISVINYFKLILAGRRQAIKFIKDNNINYVLSAWALPSGVIAYLASQKTKIKYGVWSLGSDLNKFVKIPILRQFILLSIKNANNRFANSYLLKNKMNKLSGKQSIFMPAITEFNITSIKPINLNSQNNILFVGRLEKVKGPDILLNAVKILAHKKINFKLNTLGSGSMDNELKDFVNDNKLNRFVKFHGFADKNTVASFMKSSSLLAVPSRSESLPLVILEAAHANLPVVAADVGDCKRIISKYKIGSIFEPGKPAELADKIIQNLAKKHKSTGFSRLKNDFTQAEAAKILLNNI